MPSLMSRRIVPTAERTVTRDGDKKLIDKEEAIRERRPLIKGYSATIYAAAAVA
jgi:hypothetical protein